MQLRKWIERLPRQSRIFVSVVDVSGGEGRNFFKLGEGYITEGF